MEQSYHATLHDQHGFGAKTVSQHVQQNIITSD
jgi:hypothetical protein